MLEFIVRHRLIFVCVVTGACVLLSAGAGGQVRRRIAAGLLGLAVSSCVVSLGILFHLNETWWLSKSQLADHTVKVPNFLSALQPLADQAKRIDGVQNSVQASIVALRTLVHYLAAALVAYFFASVMAAWRFYDFVHDLRAMRAEFRARQY